jgi:hypothetical protein
MLQFAGCETDAQRQLRKDLGNDVASEIVRPATSLARLQRFPPEETRTSLGMACSNVQQPACRNDVDD